MHNNTETNPTRPGAEFNRDYYEDGVAKGVSAYEAYRWLPHYVLPLANTIQLRFGRHPTLDYGCAKGYLVKALRLFGVAAYGYDISEYAITNADMDVREVVSNDLWAAGFPGLYHLIIAKDTLEHVPEVKVQGVLRDMRGRCAPNGQAFIVVPLGDGRRYRIREYELDATHMVRQDEVWWMKRFAAGGWETREFYYSMPGVKEHWTQTHPTGNGIFILRRA